MDKMDKYETLKKPNELKLFLLCVNPLPELIYGTSGDFWFSAEGKGGLFEFKSSQSKRKQNLSLNEIYNTLENIPYDFTIGYSKEKEKYLALHPISGKMTEWKNEEEYIRLASEYAFRFAKKSKTRNQNLEKLIAKDSKYSYQYAKEIIKGRFEAGEATIAKEAHESFFYALEVLKGRFELGEMAISKSGSYSRQYAQCILNERFKLGEPAIVAMFFEKDTKRRNQAYSYVKKFKLSIELIDRR
jgi:hypothetical protein